MNSAQFTQALADLPLGESLFLDKASSTNDIALALAAKGAPDMSLVYAEEQDSGRGRQNRRWFTPASSAIAVSLVLRPSENDNISIPLFAGLGAVAVCDVVQKLGLEPKIKWPNDVLLNDKKFCGILAEGVWMGEILEYIVLGIGVNVTREAIPAQQLLDFPATCIEDVSGQPMDRPWLLKEIVQAVISWRRSLNGNEFIQAWETRLAYLGQVVNVNEDMGKVISGKMDGLEKDGSLRLILPNNDLTKIIFGEVHLRPVV